MNHHNIQINIDVTDLIFTTLILQIYIILQHYTLLFANNSISKTLETKVILKLWTMKQQYVSNRTSSSGVSFSIWPPEMFLCSKNLFKNAYSLRKSVNLHSLCMKMQKTHTLRGLESTIIHFPNITVCLLEFLFQLAVTS